MKIWIDITNSPHVHFLYPIIRHLSKTHELFITARDFSETIPMLESKGIKPIIIGDHKGKSKFKKVLGMLDRIRQINSEVPDFDFSISIGGQITSVVSWIRHKKSIIFTDNDISYKYHVYKIGSYFIFPKNFSLAKINKIKGNSRKVFQYNGFKEQVYIADFVPNPSFIEIVPIQNYLLIRPENLKASYVPTNAKTLIPALFECFKDEKVLYMPRYSDEREYANGYSNVFIPEKPLNGLDACYYSKAVLTGAGTFAREAAMLGVPAVSFFPRNELLSVDQELVNQGKIHHSRDINQIKDYVDTAQRVESEVKSNITVQSEVLEIIDSILKGNRK
jgi:predicted glycosyltransferase